MKVEVEPLVDSPFNTATSQGAARLQPLKGTWLPNGAEMKDNAKWCAGTNSPPEKFAVPRHAAACKPLVGVT